MHKPNNLLVSDVEEALESGPLLNASRIIVKAGDWMITLSGAEESCFDLTLASKDA